MIEVSAAHESLSRVRCCVCIERRLEILWVVRLFETGSGRALVVERLQLSCLEMEE
jgi:hypothetical protein